MDMESPNDWIKDLKVGDLVFFDDRLRGNVLTKVKKITPAKNIIIEYGDIVFKPNGSERSGDVWTRRHLFQATPDAIAEHSRQRKIKYLNDLNFGLLENKLIEEVYGLVKPFMKKLSDEIVAAKKEKEGGS